MAGWFWLRVFPEAVVKLWARPAVLKISLGLRIPFQDGSLTWLLMEGLSSWPPNPSIMGLEYLCDIQAGFLQSK